MHTYVHMQVHARNSCYSALYEHLQLYIPLPAHLVRLENLFKVRITEIEEVCVCIMSLIHSANIC